jgi:hypothetical protein
VPTPIPVPNFSRPRELAWVGLILIVCFWVFRHVPIQQGGGDARYSLLVGENLLRHGDFALERYHLPSPDYRLEDAGGHRSYGFPLGSSILSIPYLALMHLRGESVVHGDGSYDFDKELVLEARLAALLMAAFCALVYLTARRLLPRGFSLVVTSASAFGTQVLSTMSRTLWSDTWGVLLVGVAAFLLFDAARRERAPNLIALATLEVWAYVVRPTNVLVLMGTTVYLLLALRRRCWPFVVTAAGWLTLFVAYSWRHFHRFVPSYYQAGRLTFRAGPAALLGNLVSPSRGLLICVPLVVGVAILLLRYRHTVALRPLVALALSIVAGHLAMLAGFEHWWGGHCFGARLTASLVPWIVLLEIVALDAFRVARQQGAAGAEGPWLLALASLLSLASVAINAVGAFSREAEAWNVTPNINQSPERLWSWQRPQFLAPFVDPAGPFLALPAGGLSFGDDQSASYLGRGWSGPEGSWRWTDGAHATVRFAGPSQGSPQGALELEARPYLGGGRLSAQRLVVTLNGQQIQTLELDRPQTANHELVVPAGLIQTQNTLRFDLPGAASPANLERTGDHRQLGIAATALRWRRSLAP